ncbi:uncharacterized protein MYCGRDRAFT_97817 [Zymoseptoria tritici IPO323]|uniref:Uncharacterized protein n=1 Tax=Zymoseptoria tritici (strain CBS 115943 / IPO323) TaxID=336722 RepID=F9XRG6_ZYMTI|nr:uncharacterized protein MYCGRDRAFT_97817 [Zymoseptoria tritici IPO323]EGP82132.1 hypothetical protein MYCGRDRAFT_97817 [Zymoseptoria tritici IPO323]
MSDVRAARLELWKLFDQSLQSSLASQSPPSVFHVARAIRRYDVLDASKNAVRRWFSHRYAVLFEQYTGLDVRREFFAARSAKEQCEGWRLGADALRVWVEQWMPAVEKVSCPAPSLL